MGQDILIAGSRTLWNDLLAHDLVDEIHLLVGSRILGAGRAVFANQAPTALRLIETRRWEGSDSVLLRYAVIHKSEKGSSMNFCSFAAVQNLEHYQHTGRLIE